MKYKIRKHLKEFSPVSYAAIPELITKIPKGELIDCSYGTNPYGYSKEVAGYLNMLCENPAIVSLINDYPDATYSQARKAICEFLSPVVSLDIDNVRLSAGSMGGAECIASLFIDSGTKILGFAPQFSEFGTVVEAHGGVYDTILLKEENNYKFVAEELISAMTDEHVLIYIDNPTNPTGQLISLSDIEAICVAAKKIDAMVVVDEAYGDFVELEYSAAALMETHDNIILMRSLSKGHGIAALRVGYFVASKQLMVDIDKVYMAFTVTTLSAMVCERALRDRDFIKMSREKIANSKRELLSSLKKFKWSETEDSVPIFVLTHPNENVDLFLLLAENKVFAEPAYGFRNLPKNTVRLRIPKDINPLLEVLLEIESKI